MSLSKKLAIDHIPHLIKGSRVLMRVDFNVPMKDGQISDPKRIVSTLPSINYLLENGAKSVVLMSHMGRPKGAPSDKFSLAPLVPAVSDFVGKKVTWVPDCVGAEASKVTANAKDGEVILLENLRFYTAEEGKGEINGEKVKASAEDIAGFRKQLTSHGDLYVNDAFGTAHRAHSSMVGIDVETRASGFLLKKELEYFSKVLEGPDRPLTVVMGGAKVKDKIQLIYNMLDIVDEITHTDRIFEAEDVRIVCDPRSYLYVKGTEIDFEDSIMGGGFKFGNPNVTRSCGCGTSFQA